MAGYDTSDLDGLRAPWGRSDRPLPRRVLQPLQSFLAEEAASGVLLLVATLVALLWVNSPWGDTYERFWHTDLSLRLGGHTLHGDLRHWVNDGLMTLFFLVVGLEIKRELTTGELRDRRAVALPAIAAVGGMVVPALIYVALNAGSDAVRGWGIPMATDIAFALGVLTIAATRAPSSLKPFLLTLAIVDDIGAILVIALFYSGGITWPALGVAFVLVLAIVGLQRIHVRAIAVYLALGFGVWLAFYESGMHPTIAGVILGLLTPSVPFQRPRAVSEEAHRTADETVDDPFPPDADAPQWIRLAQLSREAVSPLARVEAGLHPWTSSVIVPVFALANAGVVLTAETLVNAATSPIVHGIVLGLVVGKFLGVLGGSALAIRLRLGRLPDGAGWRDMAGAAAVAGIGFTVSLFIADIAFPTRAASAAARGGILFASMIAGCLGFLVLRAGRRGRTGPT